MQNVGRNDPCPCGSGKKFKKCHGEQQTAPALDTWKRTIQMDQRLMTQVAKLGATRFAEQGFDPFFLEPEEETHDHAHGEDCDHDHDVMFADVSFPLALYCDPRFGQKLGDIFLEQKGKFLPPDERAWIVAQNAAHYSLWQLTGLGADGEITLHNRLDDRTLTLFDGDAHKEGKKDDLFLARVVHYEDRHVMTSMHPEIIESDDVEAAVAHIKKALEEAPDAADPTSYTAQLALVDAWHDVVFGDEEEDDDETDETASA